MKAARIHEFGGSDKIHIEDIPTPPLRPGEALIRVHAAGVNPVDWMIREHIYNPEGADRVPMILGQDFSGVIEQIAQGSTTDFHQGDPVFGETWGSFAELITVPLKDIVRKPESLDFATAASIPMPGLTAWQMVIDVAKASPGMKFLIHGAGGPVGSFAAQFAKWKGAQVFVTASAPSFEFLHSIGVDGIIDYKREHFENKVRDIDVVIDPIGGDVQARSWPLIRKGGMLINLIGEINQDSAKKAGIRGIEFGMEYDIEDLRQIIELVEHGIIKPHISKILPLNRAQEAMDINQQGQSHGKIILKVA